MTQVEMRDATDNDLPAILRILGEAGIEDGHTFTVEEAKEHLAQLRRVPWFRLLVAIVDGEVVGTYSLLIMQKLGKRGTPAGLVEDVAVAPSRQGHGIGKAMMRHAMNECRQAGCYKLALSSNLRREPAHRFYESLGFERHGYSYVCRL